MYIINNILGPICISKSVSLDMYRTKAKFNLGLTIIVREVKQLITQNEIGQIIVLFTRTKLVKRKKLVFFSRQLCNTCLVIKLLQHVRDVPVFSLVSNSLLFTVIF